jgi:hypothetical protein
MQNPHKARLILPAVTPFRKRQAYLEIMVRSDMTFPQKQAAIEILRQIPVEEARK